MGMIEVEERAVDWPHGRVEGILYMLTFQC